jgi:hypothetical protein
MSLSALILHPSTLTSHTPPTLPSQGGLPQAFTAWKNRNDGSASRGDSGAGSAVRRLDALGEMPEEGMDLDLPPLQFDLGSSGAPTPASVARPGEEPQQQQQQEGSQAVAGSEGQQPIAPAAGQQLTPMSMEPPSAPSGNQQQQPGALLPRPIKAPQKGSSLALTR